MDNRAPRYTPEFRQQMIELYRRRGSFNELAKEFAGRSWSIRKGAKQADRDASSREGGLSSAERKELSCPWHENRRLREEREALSKAAACFAIDDGTIMKRSSDS